VKIRSVAALVPALIAVDARADSGLDSPEAGVVQVGRGSAWVARADDPTAAFYNPAAMVTQPHGVHLGAHLLIRQHCMERLDENGQPVSPGPGTLAPPDEVCADILPLPNPQVAGSIRLHRHVALGLAVVAPHGHGLTEWPATITYPNSRGFDQELPAPTRYLALESQGLLLYPTVSLGVAILKELSLGAGFIWGVASVKFAAMAEAVSQPQDNFDTDVRAQIDGVDGFVPGFVVSALGAPHERVDIGAWFKWMDAVRMDVDLHTQANYYDGSGAVDEDAIADPQNNTKVNDAGRFKLPIPMEARLGVRYHHPRDDTRGPQEMFKRDDGWMRDAMTEDLFDVEVDFTWAHNSAVDAVELRFQPNIFINGTSAGIVPENGDVPHNWTDVFGARLGGEFVIIPDFVAVRAGGFFESQGADDQYMNLDFHLGWRAGASAGATVRLGGPGFHVDLSLAYQHTFFGSLDNGGQGGVRALSGDRTTGSTTPDPSDDFRSINFKNGGRTTSMLDEIALGATFRF
jgi:long-chain fatty acid transport protein